MDKETFYKLLKDAPKIAEARQKELEENDLFVDYDEEREDVYVMLWRIPFIFDQKGYRIFEELWNKGVLTPKDNYLYVKGSDWKDLIPVHRYLKIKEVEELSKKLDCLIQDIHVHHRNKDPGNNRLSNLEVLHKDEHAKRHGFNDWELLQKWRKNNIKKSIP